MLERDDFGFNARCAVSAAAAHFFMKYWND